MTSRMTLNHPRRQAGLSFFSLIFALVLFGFALLLGFRVFPSIVENRSIDAVIQKAVTDGHTPAAIRASFDRGADTWRPVRQDAILPHERPGRTAIEKAIPDAVAGCVSEECAEFVRCLQGFAPLRTSRR